MTRTLTLVYLSVRKNGIKGSLTHVVESGINVLVSHKT